MRIRLIVGVLTVLVSFVFVPTALAQGEPRVFTYTAGDVFIRLQLPREVPELLADSVARSMEVHATVVNSFLAMRGIAPDQLVEDSLLTLDEVMLSSSMSILRMNVEALTEALQELRRQREESEPSPPE